MEVTICPCCGYSGFEEPAYKGGRPHFGCICPCCFFQFGLDEDDNSFVKWRIHWIMEGAPFMDKNLYSPEEWTISRAKEQLSNLQRLNWEAIPEWIRNINSLDWTTNYDESLLNANW